jgi:hypothetical protein
MTTEEMKRDNEARSMERYGERRIEMGMLIK